LDHGGRHPDMPKKLSNAFIFTCNVSFEFEKSEQTANVNYSSGLQRDKMVEAERAPVDERVRKVIALKRQVCDTPDKYFVVVNQKGIDPLSLDLFAKEGILALRRAKRRNMERLVLACGGLQVNSVDGLTPEILGHADSVYEYTLGEEKYTFIEGLVNPLSCTILIRGPNDHSITQIKDAVRDGLRAAKNAIEDGHVVPGAGAFELAAYRHLQQLKSNVKGSNKIGADLFSEALLIIPKTLASNSGLDVQQTIVNLLEEHSEGHVVGLNLATGDGFDAAESGVWDNYRVKRQILHSSVVVASQLLLVDEIIKAGKTQAQHSS